MNAERTLIDITFGMRITGIVWASLDAGAAANTFAVLNQDNSALFEVTGAGRTATYTGRIVAVVATFRPKLNAHIRVGSVNYFNHPVAAKAYRYIIFGLAGHHAVAATYAFTGINGHCISHN
jgi:hypothetical protein